MVSTTPNPGKATTLKSQHESKNAYKSEYGYSVSEVYDSNTQKNDADPTSTVPDSRLLYHSFSNPLFRSNSLNIEPHGDIHKISSPFQSSWIFSPSYGRPVEKRRSPNLKSILTSGPSDFKDSSISPTNFSLKFSNNVTLPTLNSNNSLSMLENNASILASMPFFDKLETFDDIAPSFRSTTTSTTVQPLTQKSFFGYNIKEVTSNGKTHGTVQVFGNDGVEKNLKYDELTKPSNITKLLPNITTESKNSSMAKKIPVSKTPLVAVKVSTSPTKPFSGTTTAIPKLSNPTKPTTQKLIESTTHSLTPPRHIIIEDMQPLAREFTHDQPIASDFATPEFILYDFLGQLQNFPYVPADNLDNNRYTTFDELVSENTYVYKKR